MKASDIRRGHVVIVEGQPCRVMDFQHRTPGNLRAFVQVRLRNLHTGNTFDTRFSATENVQDARLDTKELQEWPGHARLRFHCTPARTTVDCPTPLGHHRW